MNLPHAPISCAYILRVPSAQSAAASIRPRSYSRSISSIVESQLKYTMPSMAERSKSRGTVERLASRRENEPPAPVHFMVPRRIEWRTSIRRRSRGHYIPARNQSPPIWWWSNSNSGGVCQVGASGDRAPFAGGASLGDGALDDFSGRPPTPGKWCVPVRFVFLNLAQIQLDGLDPAYVYGHEQRHVRNYYRELERIKHDFNQPDSLPSETCLSPDDCEKRRAIREAELKQAFESRASIPNSRHRYPPERPRRPIPAADQPEYPPIGNFPENQTPPIGCEIADLEAALNRN